MGILRDLTGPIPSRDAPPFRFGLKPRHDALGRIRDRAAHRASVGTLERIIAKHVDPIRAELGLAPLHRLEEFYLAASLVLAYTAEPVRRPAQRLAHESPPGRTRAVEPPADTPSWLADLRQPLVLVTLLWAIDSTLPGMDAVRVSGTVVLVLGFAASASAVVPTFFALLHGNKAYLAVTSLLGLGALIAGLVMLIAASEAGFAVLTAVLLVLWAVTDGSSCPSREEHVDNRRHRPGTGAPAGLGHSVTGAHRRGLSAR